MKKNKCEISVIMPVYNTPVEMLELSINSILNQSFNKFEFIIIDDCSNQKTQEYLRSVNDQRIIIVRNKATLGITKSLNIGIKKAKGKYIARMDSDDISLPYRLQEQYDFMEKNDKVIVCGTWYKTFGDAETLHSEEIKRRIPNKQYNACTYLFGNFNGLCHPSAMFRKSLLIKYNISYNESLPYAQDYEMWSRCCRYGELQNVEKILFLYRIHNKRISESKKDEQTLCAQQVRGKLLRELFGNVSDKMLVVHERTCNRKDISVGELLWLKRLIKQNQRFGIYEERAFGKCVENLMVEKGKNAVTNTHNPLKVLFVLLLLPVDHKSYVLKLIKNRMKRKIRW